MPDIPRRTTGSITNASVNPELLKSNPFNVSVPSWYLAELRAMEAASVRKQITVIAITLR